jgi:hypothetical protein
MIEKKDLPSEYVSIRQVWLKRIDDCGRAISQRAIQEPTNEREWREIGDRTVIYTVNALYTSLVDYGEATIRSDVDKYRKNKYNPKINETWDKCWGKFDDDEIEEKFKKYDVFEKDKKIKEFKKSLLSPGRCWNIHCSEAIKLYDFIIQTLNKYGMLFESQPRGYSNVEMKSV